MSTQVAREAPIPLRVPSTRGIRVSKGACARLCRANPALRIGRSTNGEPWMRTPAAESSSRNAALTAHLWAWNHTEGHGVHFDSSAAFALANGMIHAPIASWIPKDCWEALPPARRKFFAPIVPDPVADLTSPSDSLSEARGRLVEFINQGTRPGRLLHPKTGRVEIHRPDRPVEIRERPESLDGANVHPRFVLDLRGIPYD